MRAYKETILTNEDVFPVEVFIKDNQIENLSVAPHFHECVEVLCYLEGEATQQIDDRTFSVKAGDVVIVNMGVIHSTHCDDGVHCKVLVLKFMPHLIDESYSFIDAKYVHLFFSSTSMDNYLIKNIVQKDSLMYQQFLVILNEYEVKDNAYELVVKGSIYQLLGMFIRKGNIGTLRGHVNQKRYMELKPVISYIEMNYKQSLEMTGMAELIGMSYYHFSRTFKELVGIKYKEFVDRVRIAEADKQIIDSNKQFTEIAFEVGFNNVASFNRVYKRVKGITPSEMRQMKQDYELNDKVIKRGDQ